MSKNSWWKQSGVARRDERAAKDTPEVSSKGKRSPKSKPWILEYRLPKGAFRENVWFMFKPDGEWHNYAHRRFAKQQDALKSMEQEKKKGWHLRWERYKDLEWRIRNTEET